MKKLSALILVSFLLCTSVVMAENWRQISGGGDVKTFRGTPVQQKGTFYYYDLWEMTIFKNQKAIKNIPFKYFKTRITLDCEKGQYFSTDKFYFDANHKEVYKELFNPTVVDKGMTITVQAQRKPVQPGSYEATFCTQKKAGRQQVEAKADANTIKHIQEEIPKYKKEIADLKGKVRMEKDPNKKKNFEKELEKKENYLDFLENNLATRKEQQQQ